MMKVKEENNTVVKTKQALNSIPRGKPKSGRKWKTVRENRHSEFKRDKHLKTSWEQKMKQRTEIKNVKQFERELKEAKAKELEEKRIRQAANQKRKEEAAKKAEVVQTIKNTAKLKRMKKKHLRMIEKR